MPFILLFPSPLLPMGTAALSHPPSVSFSPSLVNALLGPSSLSPRGLPSGIDFLPPPPPVWPLVPAQYTRSSNIPKPSTIVILTNFSVPQSYMGSFVSVQFIVKNKIKYFKVHACHMESCDTLILYTSWWHKM